jgi:hypothetical protein
MTEQPSNASRRHDYELDEYAAIGQMFLNAARLERFAHYLVWELMDLDNHSGSAVTSQMPFVRVLELINRLAAARGMPSDELEELQGWTARAKRFSVDIRNPIAHGMPAMNFEAQEDVVQSHGLLRHRAGREERAISDFSRSKILLMPSQVMRIFQDVTPHFESARALNAREPGA